MQSNKSIVIVGNTASMMLNFRSDLIKELLLNNWIVYAFVCDFNEEQLIDRICEFTSRIWQVHPFQEGNTRTTAIFIQKYLISMGFKVNNELFKDNSKYFRNALVRSNYGNIPKGIYPIFDYLIMFFENLLQNKNNDLKNSELYVKELFENNN